MKDEGTGITEINATGDHTHIVTGDAVEQQRVGVQHVATQHIGQAYMASPPPPNTGNLEPCPMCGRLNAPRAEQCAGCNHPIAGALREREAFVWHRRAHFAIAVFFTVFATASWVWSYTMPHDDFMSEIQVLMRQGIRLATLIGCAITWTNYWLRFGRHA